MTWTLNRVCQVSTALVRYMTYPSFVIDCSGRVDANMVKRFEAIHQEIWIARQKSPNKPMRLICTIDSQGGDSRSGWDIVDILNRIKKVLPTGAQEK